MELRSPRRSTRFRRTANRMTTSLGSRLTCRAPRATAPCTPPPGLARPELRRDRRGTGLLVPGSGDASVSRTKSVAAGLRSPEPEPAKVPRCGTSARAPSVPAPAQGWPRVDQVRPRQRRCSDQGLARRRARGRGSTGCVRSTGARNREHEAGHCGRRAPSPARDAVDVHRAGRWIETEKKPGGAGEKRPRLQLPTQLPSRTAVGRPEPPRPDTLTSPRPGVGPAPSPEPTTDPPAVEEDPPF